MAHQVTDKTRAQVESASAIGIAQDDIARLLGITAKTLRRRYRNELDNGATKANIAIGGALYSKAKGGDTTAQIWWTKARMGWRGDEARERPGSVVGVLQELARRLPD